MNTPKNLILAGGGHSHVIALKRICQQRPEATDITLVSKLDHTPYSGMLPGLIAGHYTHDETHIHLPSLCDALGVRFVKDEIIGLDPTRQQIQLKQGGSLNYDLLSLDIGSTPVADEIEGAREHSIGVKPVEAFLHWWQAFFDQAQHWPADKPLRIGVVGAGAGGLETLLAMQYAIEQAQPELAGRSEYHLFNRGNSILTSHNRKVQHRYLDVLNARRVHLHNAIQVSAIKPRTVIAEDGTRWELDAIIRVTQASAAPWLTDNGLALDADGFVAVSPTLQSTSHPQVFAAGDIASVAEHPRPKAGVFAVRQGPPLADNLLRALRGLPLEPFEPQHQFLSLITTGDRYAIASKGQWMLQGRWVWRWKDWIDRKFMRQFQV